VDFVSRSCTTLLLVVFLAYLPACQLHKNMAEEGLDNARFMSVWQIYTRCITSSDPHLTQQDSLQLRTAIHGEDGSGGLGQKQGSRLAVDLKAMSASCTLHAGDIAATSGHSETARDMFMAVLNEHSEPLYAYYAEQARARLSKLGPALQALLQSS
jgi:hypothetical protein